MSREITHQKWAAEARDRFGDNPMDWRFVCPSCGYEASARDWHEVGASSLEVGFSCIGRHIEGSREMCAKGPGPCNYAGGGLFRLNPVTVITTDGREIGVFEFADIPEQEIAAEGA